MSDDKEQVQNYQKLVLAYEALDGQIDSLLEHNGGHTENMSDADMQTYRNLAGGRDDLYNQIKAVEAGWLLDEE